MADQLPDYDPLQRAFHQAFEPELTEVIGHLTVAPDARVLDVPCGDGFFTRRLAGRLSGAGRVVGIDQSQAYLDRAARAGGPAEYRRGDAYALPSDAAAFDLALSAMSFISIAEPVRALREVHRVLTVGGTAAVLETDEYHHVLLTWPVDVEVARQRGLRDASGGRLSPARKVNRMLRDAGFGPPRKKTFAADRHAPFSPEVAAFLGRYLAFLRGLIQPHLTRDELARFDRCADPSNPGSLFHAADAELTCLLTLHQAPRLPG